MAKPTAKQKRAVENDELRARLQEMEDTLEAIRSGSVDAIVTSGPEGDRVYTLEGAEHAYHVMVESMNEGAVTILTDGTILYGNRQFAQMTGESPSGIVGRPFHDFVPASDHSIWNGFLHRARAGGLKAEIMLRNESAAGMPVLISANPIDLGGTKALALVVTNLSERKRHEEIVAAERLSRYILEQSLEGVAVCVNGRIIRASRRLHEICGRNPLMQPFDELFPLRMSESEPFSVEIPHSGKVVKGAEVSYQNPDGKSYSLILNAGPLYGDEHKILGCLVNLTDITERKRAEGELRNSEEALRQANESLEQRVRDRTMELQTLTEQLARSRDDLRNLALELVMAEERERKRIAGVLHDEIAQSLAAVRMRLDLLQAMPSEPERRQTLAEATTLIAQSLQETRALMTDIGNPLLFDMGLKAACESLVDRLMKKHPIRIRCDIRNTFQKLKPDVKTILYQVVRELLNNVVKHSKAQNGHVMIEMENGHFRVKVTDDGLGFDPQKLGVPNVEGGFGLYSIRERLIAIDGKFKVESAPGSGTVVTVILPEKIASASKR